MLPGTERVCPALARLSEERDDPVPFGGLVGESKESESLAGEQSGRGCGKGQGKEHCKKETGKLFMSRGRNRE